MHELTKEALKEINKPEIRRRLMDELGVTEFTIARYIQKNNDALTKYSAMRIIRQLTGWPDEKIVQEKTVTYKRA